MFVGRSWPSPGRNVTVDDTISHSHNDYRRRDIPEDGREVAGTSNPVRWLRLGFISTVSSVSPNESHGKA
jgi:hypothetical protein